MIRHLTATNNVKNGKVIDATLIKHGVITALRVQELSGWVDPTTHLNLDFSSHIVGTVNVVEKLEKGAKILINDNGSFLTAIVNRAAYGHFGAVDVFERMQKFRQVANLQPTRQNKVKE